MRLVVKIDDDIMPDVAQYLCTEASFHVKGVLEELNRDPAMGREDEGRVFSSGREVGTWTIGLDRGED